MRNMIQIMMRIKWELLQNFNDNYDEHYDDKYNENYDGNDYEIHTENMLLYIYKKKYSWAVIGLIFNIYIYFYISKKVANFFTFS